MQEIKVWDLLVRATEKFQSWPIPGGGDIVRNVDVTADGHVVTANSLVNQVGMLELR
jgi:virginiamycin B lyase